jgi:exonuclease III
MEREQPDVVCLQEIKASPARAGVSDSLGVGGDYRTFWHGSGCSAWRCS